MQRPAHFDAWLYLAIAFPVAVAFALLTPPFQSPDEVAHYWRSAAIARGQLLPEMQDGRAGATVPTDTRDLVAALWMELAGKTDLKFDRAKLSHAWALKPGVETVRVKFPAFYTPVVYAPQAAAIAISRVVQAPTLAGFYAGRIANALVAVLLVFLAMRLLPEAGWIFGVVGLTPMFLFISGAFSADAVTAGLAFCAIAAALRPHGARTLPLFCGLAALAKPGYALVSLLTLPRWRFRPERARVIAALLATVVCGALAAAGARAAYYPLRSDVPTEAAAQSIHVIRHPLQFVQIAATDYWDHAAQYRDQLIGRLGWLDVGLPSFVIFGYLILFVYAALSVSLRLSAQERLMAALAFGGSLLLLSLSQYLVWTPVGAAQIEGLQGRYFLPIAALALLSIAIPQLWLHRWVIAVTTIAGNVVALLALVKRYYGL